MGSVAQTTHPPPLYYFSDGGVPHDTLEWGSLEPITRTNFNVFGAKNILKWELRRSREQTNITKYMDFGATIGLRNPSNGANCKCLGIT